MASAAFSVVRSRRCHVSQAVWRTGSAPFHGPSLAPGRPLSSNSRWSELPVAASGAKRTVAWARRAALRTRPSARVRGLQEEAPPAADLVEGQGDAQVRAPF